MTAPLVSCVVPVHDGEAYLAAAIDSILGQTHRPLEVVVVDDGSSDASAAIADRYGPPVRVRQLRARQGVGAARSAGLEACTGEYVGFLDADDLWLPEKLDRQLAHLAGPPRLGVSFCGAENFWEPGQEAEAERWRAAGRIRGTYVISAALARREVFAQVPLDATANHFEHAAWVMSLRSEGVPIGVLPATLLRRRRHASNITRTQLPEHFDAVFDLLKSNVDHARAARSEA